MSLGAQNPWKVSQGHKIVWIYILIVKLNVLTIWLMFIALKISYTTKNYFIWKSSQERIRCHENSLGSVVAINAIRFPATGAQMLLILTQWNSQESSCFRRVAMAPTQTRFQCKYGLATHGIRQGSSKDHPALYAYEPDVEMSRHTSDEQWICVDEELRFISTFGNAINIALYRNKEFRYEL